MLKHDVKLEKDRISVEVHMSDDSRYEGDIFVNRGERLQDLLNGSRNFFPLIPTDRSKETMLIHKRWIKFMIEK